MAQTISVAVAHFPDPGHAIGRLAGRAEYFRVFVRISPRQRRRWHNGSAVVAHKTGPAAANLADLYRGLGREVEAEHVLRATLAMQPTAVIARHALGLSLIRQRRLLDATAELKPAAEGDPSNGRFALVYALALQSSSRDAEAGRVLEAALEPYPADVEIATALLQKALRVGDLKSALQLSDGLISLRPEVPLFAEIRKQLRK